jgi:hypothetical protein
MATPVTLTSILKAVQQNGTMDPDKALVRECKALQMIPHKKDFHGSSIDWTVPYAGLGGRSHTASNSESNDVNGAYARFSISRKHDYVKRTMDGDMVRAALKGGPSEQFIQYVDAEMGLAVAALGQNLGRGFYGSRSGRRGVVGSFTGATITLATVDDALNWQIGDKVCHSLTDGSALLSSGASLAITGVNTETGVLTFGSTVASTLTAIANADSLYVLGDLNLSYSGWDTYNPATAPTSGDAVFGSGVDRSAAPELLAGIRCNTATSGTTLETVLIKALSNCRKKQGSYFSEQDVVILVSEEDFSNQQIAKEGSRFVDSDNQYGMGVKGFYVGNAKVVPDVFCPNGDYRIKGNAGFELHSIDGADIDTTDGNTLRKASSDTYTLSAIIDGDFQVRYPAAMGRGTFPST